MKKLLKSNKILRFLIKHSYVIAALIWTAVMISNGYSIISWHYWMGFALLTLIKIQGITYEIDFPEYMPRNTDVFISFICLVFVCLIVVYMSLLTDFKSILFFCLLLCECGIAACNEMWKSIKKEENVQTETVVILEPTKILIVCPHCGHKNEKNFLEFCSEHKESLSRNQKNIVCEECGKLIEIQGTKLALNVQS